MSDELLPGTPTGPQLKEIFELALANCRVVSVAVLYDLDVILPMSIMTPEWKAKQDIIRLEYGLDMPVPITDLEITDEGITATLSFSRIPCHTYVPWKAVAGIHGETEQDVAPPPPKKRPSFLKVVK